VAGSYDEDIPFWIDRHASEVSSLSRQNNRFAKENNELRKELIQLRFEVEAVRALYDVNSTSATPGRLPPSDEALRHEMANLLRVEDMTSADAAEILIAKYEREPRIVERVRTLGG
jgi:hypothetical protein